MSGLFRIFCQSVIFGVAEFRALYTWRSWTFGWLLRLITQVAFFALIGRLVGTIEVVQFILVGNIVVIPCLEATAVILSVTGERWFGTLPLLMTTPTSHIPVFLGRGLQWLVTGFASSLITLLVVPPVLGASLPWPTAVWVIPMLLVVGISGYCYSCFLAGLAFRRVGLEWLLVNVGYLAVMAFCGVDVPTSFWPHPIRLIADFFPVTHGLAAARAALAGLPPADVVRQIALELAVGLGWLILAVVSFERIVSRGRLNGSFEFTD